MKTPDTGLNKWDWLGVAAGIIPVMCMVAGAIFGYKGSQERQAKLDSQRKHNN